MSSPEGIILEQFYEELKEKGIKLGNKVKLRNDDVSTIVDINPYEPDFPIVIEDGKSYTTKGIYFLARGASLDIVDWDYKDLDEEAPSNPYDCYWDNGEDIEVPSSNTFIDDVFIKHDKGKPMISLIEPKFIEGLAEVMTQGANKYGRDNWKECKEPHRYLDALLRHTLKYWSGEKVDTESGKSHLYHIAFNAMALDYLDNKLKG